MMKYRRMKPILMVLSLILILSCTIGGTMAYLAAKSETAENAFEGGSVSCAVKQGNIVENTGTVPAFIRVRVVANLLDSEGRYYEKSPAVKISGEDWEQSGDCIYYTKEVAVSSSTSALTVALVESAPEGYSLQYTVLAEAIQSDPVTTVTSIWGYTPVD